MGNNVEDVEKKSSMKLLVASFKTSWLMVAILKLGTLLVLGKYKEPSTLGSVQVKMYPITL